MTDLTCLQIGARLRRESLGAAEYQDLLRAITARRRVIKTRLAEIEGANGATRRAAIASADPAQLAILNREAETLDDEVGILCDLEARCVQLHTRAAEQETTESARKARKQLPALIGRAAEALRVYDEARSALSVAADAISAVRHEAYVTTEDFERIAAALFPAGLMHGDHLHQARCALRGRICAPPLPQYGDAGPDYREQIRRVMRR